MSSSINADGINEYIHQLAKDTGCSKRKERLELLDKIAEKGKELIGDISTADKNVCEIMEDINDIYDEMTKWQEEVADAEDVVEDDQKSLSDLYEELDPLTVKEANGTLTDTEKARLKELRDLVKAKEQEASGNNSDLDALGDGSSYTNSITSDFDMLEELTANMEGYAEAGEVIKNSAHTYGKKNMDCEAALERNEKAWLVGSSNKMNTYLNRMGYTETGDNSQTFYDATDHEFIAEYDVIEGKGGNQIQGKMRKATAKVYSYGKTITTAANIVKEKPNEVQNKKPIEETENK